MSQSRAGFAALDAWLDRQPEPVTLVTMESSGHYWMPLASHLRRRDVPVAVVNPLAAKYFAKSRLARTKSDPADARSLAEMAMRDTPPARDPLAGAELRQAARFAMTLVDGAGEGLPAAHPPRRARLPGARRAVRRPHLPDGPGGPADRARRRGPPRGGGRRPWPTPNAGPGHRRLGQAKAERLQAAAADSIAVPELDAEVAFEVGLLLDQYDLLERQIEDADARVAGLLDGELARRLQTIPGVGPSIAATLLAEIGDIERFTDFDQLLAYAGVHPAERSSGRKGSNPETAWHMSKAGNSHLRAAAYRMAVVGVQHNPVIAAHYERKRAAGKSQDERPRPLHAQGPQHRLGRLAQRSGLRPQLGARGLTRPYGI